jgi:D-mannonate dehydratase
LQYCETKDDKILDELKSWLEKMNPIQRAVMTNYLQHYHVKEIPVAEKLYNTIRLFKDKK